MASTRRGALPHIPNPIAKEQASTELLVKQGIPDLRPKMQKEPQYIQVPHYNDLYDTLRSKQAWRFTADQMASGTVTTVANSDVYATVTLVTQTGAQSPNWRLEQWPNATLLFPLIRVFNFGPQTATFTTQGEINVVYIDNGGVQIPLGILPNNNFTNNSGVGALIPTPITDPAQAAMGQLKFTLNTGATVGTYAWQIGFSAVYLLPAASGYEWKEIGREHVSDHH